MSSVPSGHQTKAQDQSNKSGKGDSLSTNQQIIGFTSRLKLPESSVNRRRNKKIPVEPTQVRVRSESELREEAAWKQVEETGKPVVLDGRLLVPDGMHVHEAMGYLPDGVREQAIEDFDRKMAGAIQILLDGAQRQLHEDAAERGELEKYEALHPIGKKALAEWVVRKQMKMPEVPLEEIIDRLQKQSESKPEPGKQSKPANVRKRPQIEKENRQEPRPVVIPEVNQEIKTASPPVFEHQESIRISQVSQWNLEHHGLLLKRLDQIWKHMTAEEQQAVLVHLCKDMGKVEIDAIDEIIKGCEWARSIEAHANKS